MKKEDQSYNTTIQSPSLGEFPISSSTKIPLFLQTHLSFIPPIFILWKPRTNQQMGGCVLKLVDSVLFLFFLLIAVVAPLIDAQTCLPLSYFPDILVQLKEQYTNDYGDYLVAEKPHFFVGLVWLELLFQWPLALLSLYAMLTSKPWFNTTCLIYGVSVTTSMVIYLSPFNSYFSSSKFLFFRFKTFVLRNSPASKIAKNTFVYLSICLSPFN